MDWKLHWGIHHGIDWLPVDMNSNEVDWPWQDETPFPPLLTISSFSFMAISLIVTCMSDSTFPQGLIIVGCIGVAYCGGLVAHWLAFLAAYKDVWGSNSTWTDNLCRDSGSNAPFSNLHCRWEDKKAMERTGLLLSHVEEEVAGNSHPWVPQGSHPSIHQSTIHPSVHLSIHPSIHSPINIAISIHFVHPSIYYILTHHP